jgi:hypothetical protein
MTKHKVAMEISKNSESAALVSVFGFFCCFVIVERVSSRCF